jgi:hypothetical protein
MGGQNDVEEWAIMIDMEHVSAQDGYVFLPVGVHVAVRCLPYKDNGVLVCAVWCSPDVEGVVGAARDLTIG